MSACLEYEHLIPRLIYLLAGYASAASFCQLLAWIHQNSRELLGFSLFYLFDVLGSTYVGFMHVQRDD